MRRRAGRALLACAAALQVAAAEAPTTAALEHHGDPSRAGVYVDPALTRAAAKGYHLDPAFDARLPGAVYAQPLYAPGVRGGPDLVVAASERNEVAAFDARSGAAIWRRTLGAPVARARLPCGNIDPLGVTGTPVIDPASRTLYLDALTMPDGGATKVHQVFALGLDDGAVRPGWPLDVAGLARRRGLSFDAAVQNQRGALALAAGTLYVPFGGHFGDCGDYHGFVFAIPLRDPAAATAYRTPARGAGIWAPGGLSAADGQLFAATGNSFGATTWGGGDAVLRFQAGAPLAGAAPDHFAPANWKELDEGDVDLGGTAPLPVDLPGATPSKLVVALGKDGKAYLLDRARLGGVGGQLAAVPVADDLIINAAAAYATAKGTYVAFRGQGKGCPEEADLTAIRLVPGAPPTARVAWCARQGGKGSPMVTTTGGGGEAIVWSVGAEGDERLHGFDGDTGAVVYAGGGPGDALGKVRRFQSPILAKGRIYVGVDGGVKAFRRD
ncbi:hypothetical protein [Anaeromyxobacter paludicola]|uniref:Pyrrolo-quinoline quinone n=1 Tax=Anaeromyxobacter paludicola TaxID=2918171 RepID=A0ABN6N7P1_9BACT|nr:hypothetical protein [Anaeromyxobacter paludicola]BDG09203.1 hypothetical protein AMPC_23160 [Anaeromyxobacter paludicola]